MNLLHRYLCRSAWWKKTITQRVSQVLADTDLGPNVLEIGPGPGLSTGILRTQVKYLTALEFDPHLAESLRSRLRGTNVDILTGDATSMPFKDAQFTAGVSFTMLHHVPSPRLQDQLLCEVCRVLQPGGFFVGSDSLQSLFMRVIHIGDTLVPVNPDTFGKRLEAAGFEVLEIAKDSRAFRFRARRPAARANSSVNSGKDRS